MVPTRSQLAESEDQGFVDVNTGLFSSKFFKSIIAKQIQSFERYRTFFSVILVTIPKEALEEKKATLREIALLIRSNVRIVDEIGSSGSGQFSILLPHTELSGAKVAAARIKNRLIERLSAEKESGLRVEALAAPENLDDIKKSFGL